MGQHGQAAQAAGGDRQTDGHMRLADTEPTQEHTFSLPAREQAALVQARDLLLLDAPLKTKSNRASLFTVGIRAARITTYGAWLLRTTICALSGSSIASPAVNAAER